MTAKPTTREQRVALIKKDLQDQGITINDWATANKFPVAEVYKVLSGERKGLYGRAHDIAVAIGLKQKPTL